MEVWILWHISPGADALHNEMLIGLYSTRDSALAAVERLCDRPGFADHPGLVEDAGEAGFLIEAYVLDEDHWTDGYLRAD